MIRINKNLENLKPSATLAINEKVKELRSLKSEVFHFGFGQSPFPVHESIVNGLIENASNNKYLPSQGLEELRKTIAKYLNEFQNVQTTGDNVFIGPGSKELLYQTILILEGIFLIPKGSWVSYGPQINAKGVDYVILDTTFENNFKLTPEILNNYCIENSKDQKTLILNSPNNPTGAVYSQDELQALAKVCKAHNIIVLSDEIYSQINFSSELSPSMSNYYPEKTILFGGLSKVFSAGGYRLGYMVLPKTLSYLSLTFQSLFSETFSAVSSPVQFAAIEAYKMNHSLQSYIKKASEILSAVSKYVFDQLSKSNIKCTQPQGAFYMLIDFNQYKIQLRNLKINTSNDLSHFILERYKVALLPGSDFYFDKDDLIFRLAYVDFNGEEVLNAYDLNSNIDINFIKTHCPNVFKGVEQLKSFVQQF